jgi:hypothetical protein
MFNKIAGYKINIQNSVAFLYTNNGKAEKEIENNPIHNSLKKIIKYLGINQTKEGKDLYKERN